MDFGPEEGEGATRGHRYAEEIPFGLVLLYEGADVYDVGTAFFLFHCVRKSVKLAVGRVTGSVVHFTARAIISDAITEEALTTVDIIDSL